jgi:hypothetical protein
VYWARRRRLHLGRDHPVDVLPCRPGHLGVLGDVAPAGLVDGTDREFGIARRAELAREHDVELAVQRIGNDLAHRRRAAWNREHDRLLAAPGVEPAGELPAGVEAVTEDHGMCRRGPIG